MKHLKLNTAFLVAVLITGITFTTQANIFGKRVITRCFTQVSLTNASCTISASLNSNLPNPTGCTVATLQASITPYITAANLLTSLPDESTCNGPEVFCCVKVAEIFPGDPGYACVPFIDLGEGLKKYKISQVFCKILTLK